MSAFDIASLPSTGTPTAPLPSANGTATPAFKIDDDETPDSAAKDAAALDGRSFFDRMWGKEGFSFGALVDIVNPLQHIPVVSTIYRAVTGDSIGPAARIVGGALFGGVIGLVASTVDAAVQEETGQDIGEHFLALHSDDDSVPTNPTDRPGYTDPDGLRPQLAGDFSPDVLDRKYALAEAAATETVAMRTTPPSATLPPTTLPPILVTPDNAPSAPPAAAARSATAPLASAATTAKPITNAATPNPAAITTASTAPRGFPLAARPREVANGAGGSTIPLTTSVPRSGRGAVELPTPQSLAADPVALRQMQGTRPPQGAVAGQPRNASSIDTTIRPNGQAGPMASFLDYTPKNAALMQAPADDGATETPQGTPAGAATPQQIDAASLPQVPADLITRMNVALQKYQTMQRAGATPSVNLTQ